MNNSESAETLVKMSIDGIKVAAQLSGEGIKNVVVILYSILNDKKKTRGKTTLKNMLKNHANIKIFTLNNQDLKKFQEEAKRYGVLYSALIDRMNPKGPEDIFIRAEDAPKVNRIIEKFNLAAVDTAEIKSKIEKNRLPKEIDSINSELDDLVEEILSKPIQKEANEETNPSMGQTKEKSLSENSLKKQKLEVVNSRKRPSVRKMLKKIKLELKEKKNKTTYAQRSNKRIKHSDIDIKKIKSKSKGR